MYSPDGTCDEFLAEVPELTKHKQTSNLKSMRSTSGEIMGCVAEKEREIVDERICWARGPDIAEDDALLLRTLSKE